MILIFIFIFRSFIQFFQQKNWSIKFVDVLYDLKDLKNSSSNKNNYFK